MALKIRSLLLFIIALLVTGCASNYYNIPRETYEKKVRILGVAPIMLDSDSDIRHPEKTEVLKIIREANRKNEKELVDILKSNGEYFSVRFLDEESDQLFATIVSRRERRDDAGIVYNKYFYKPEEIKKYIERHNVDAVMLVTVSGIAMREKIYSSNFLAYLEENYNNLIMTSQIVDAEGTVLWEYPNFRQRFITFSSLYSLQYPDFEEARANLTDQVKLKFKSIPGVNRAFTRSEDSSVKSSKKVSVLYNRQFAEMTAFLQYFRNPFEERKNQKKPGSAEAGAMQGESSSLPQDPPAAAPLQTPLTPEAMPGKPAPREFEPVKPLEPAKAVEPAKIVEPVRPLEPGTQLIKEPEIR